MMNFLFLILITTFIYSCAHNILPSNDQIKGSEVIQVIPNVLPDCEELGQVDGEFWPRPAGKYTFKDLKTELGNNTFLKYGKRKENTLYVSNLYVKPRFFKTSLVKASVYECE